MTTYSKINDISYGDWVKKLGQWHLSAMNRTDGRTLCGKPMLGNNYSEAITIEHRLKCEKCHDIANKTFNESFKAIRAYDNQGKSFDRYTILIYDKSNNLFDAIGLSHNPLSPQGFNQFCGTFRNLLDLNPEGIGKEIQLKDLPKDVLIAIIHRFLPEEP